LGLRVSTRRRETRFILALDIQPLIFTSNWAVSILDSHKCRLLIEVCSVSPYLLFLLILIVVLSVHDLLLAGWGLREHLSNVLCVRPRVIRKGACREVILWKVILMPGELSASPEDLGHAAINCLIHRIRVKAVALSVGEGIRVFT
jgi:hypothetical protein